MENKMGQREIYEFLKKHKARWFLSKEIAKKLGTNVYSIATCLKKMRYAKMVNFKQRDSIIQRNNPFLYKFKK